ncbi:tRNA uracil 4-sulfurtransferase ThiI [Candidatus Doolittlea endobia]|uniref:tRNA sulfurtransferase n=1 Tax=Candidatus Doolittlea endobia TaxID=1778262 RepID=A0A143WU90_9ENTR|nr:tRNA uracil 4-sulfurtransferase ThiI [Candidatus Doolittlea endobia]CUX96429.1 tRNA sulfurtransferase [Candidatus Doolittlea endobia]
MKFITKLFPEITIKSQSVRLRFIKILTSNIRNILKHCDKSVTVVRHWDHIEVRARNEQYRSLVADALTRIPGIHQILAVEERPWKDMHDIYLQTLAMYRERLVGKSFCVRVKRRGMHDFTSQDVERYVGGGLNQNVDNTRVNLSHPDETIFLEINHHRLLLITERLEGLGGFPVGTQEDVLSLISGGFDSGVSSYMLMRRGCRVHYCFFNLGGAVHEIGVRQMAYHLWRRFGQSHKVRFISLDFTPVLNEILVEVDDSQMGVVLKRMMVRAASAIAKRYDIQALVTGEVIGQVSSQTLTNLRLIDNASDALILRPLISHSKEHIITLARQIGTEEYAKTIPEYCGLISKSPTVRAVKSRVEKEEKQFDFAVLETVVAQAQIVDIRELVSEKGYTPVAEVEITAELDSGDIVLDIRSYNDQESSPLTLDNVSVQTLPFYKLANNFDQLDQNKSYLLYCDRGVMSRLQALYLREHGFRNVKVYRP